MRGWAQIGRSEGHVGRRKESRSRARSQTDVRHCFLRLIACCHCRLNLDLHAYCQGVEAVANGSSCFDFAFPKQKVIIIFQWVCFCPQQLKVADHS